MNKQTFSALQEEAINAGGQNYIISAGAGSGKTAVLTERIFRIAKQINSLNPFLVLTFTHLAAEEMKNRVREKLLNDQSTINLASEVDNAHIETFDSFSLYLAKKYFYKLGISKDVSIIDNTIVGIKRKQIIEQIFEEKYLSNDINFTNLIKQYCLKDDEIIKNYILNLISIADKKSDKQDFFETLKSDYNENNVKSAIDDFFIEIKSKVKFLAGEIDSTGLENPDDERNIMNLLEMLLNTKTYDELYDALLANPSLPTKPTKPKTSDGDLRSSFAEFYKKEIAFEKDVIYGKTQTIIENYLYLKPFICEIVNIANDVENRVDEYKKEHNAFAFSDISRLVIKLLDDEDIRKEISESFDYIMIDEYQDTNDIQEYVINKIERNNVYMVGDVKQSIYRFRGADCHIFQNKYQRYKAGNGGAKIDLNTSYRSRIEVVDFINDVFSKIMIPEINTIDYSDGHNFGFGQTLYIPDERYKTEIYRYSYKKAAESLDSEISIIINDIKEKINSHFQVFDIKTNSYRDATYKDFAIIIDRKTNFDKYREAFSLANIPLNAYADEELFGSDVVCVVRNLTKMLYYSLNEQVDSNEYRHAFMSVARSFLLEYSDDRLHEIYTKKQFLLEPFAQKIELIKESLRFASIKTILITLYEKFDIYSSFSKIRQFYANAHKAEHLINIADSLDSLHFTLKEFIEYFDDLKEAKLDVDFKDVGTRDNAVTLINIHQSKGLEYKIIYYSMLGKEFNNESIKSSFLISNKYGLVIPYANENSNIMIHLTKKEEQHNDFEEKIRLLYVAITRAQEKIIILEGSKENAKYHLKTADGVNSLTSLIKLSGDTLNKYYSDHEPKVFANSSSTIIQAKQVNKVQLDTVYVEPIEIVSHRASKETDSDVIESLLTFGKEIHSYIENVDFETKDLSFIKSDKMKKYISNVVNSALFKEVANSQIRKEFEFFDQINGTHGFIDALILKDDEIDIIDFKLKNIDDSEYDNQLKTYKHYISQLTNKQIKMYLLAAITGEIREVKDE